VSARGTVKESEQRRTEYLMADQNDKRQTEREAGLLMDGGDIARVLRRLSHEIAERNRGAQDLVLIGIPAHGVPLAQRLATHLRDIEGHDVPCGALDVALYRDDFSTHRAALHPSRVPFDISGKIVVLVDDVLFTGRTIRAALDALNDLGRPAAVRLAVLIDRGHRELPIRADFVGKNVPTSRDEQITVLLHETDGEDAVRLEKP
jgi:pyrimidine operon attenuation protein/uracil phosphoribosyltransferase